MPGFNPFRYRFPYTNINDINLDWIIKRVKALSEAVAHIDISRIDEIAQQAETAQQDAETALTTAQNAETTAQNAETTANSVQGIANNALTTAQSAESTANQAATTAHDASVIADNASYYASSALNVANTKASKVQNATSGNFAGLDANGNLTDSGHSSSDYAPAAAAVPTGGTTGQVLTKTGSADYAAAWQNPSGGGGDVTADMLAIVIEGNSTSVGASAGQYVIVKNSTISGITDGLYTAAQAIPVNTAINSTYLTAVSNGGFNSLMLINATINFPTPPSGVISVSGYVKNSIAFITVAVSAKPQGWFANVNISLPVEYRPSLEMSSIGFPSSSSDTSKICYGYLKTSGEFSCVFSQATNDAMTFYFTYPI